ncbi:MAG: hypothetical protein IJU81_06235 [Bacteroidales bacterium]|nr:hypothetical protein [Bacteroidales bacterium]
MKMYCRALGVALAFLFVSCNKGGGVQYFRATMVQETGAKLQLSGSHLYWTANDTISVFDASNSEANYVLDNGAGTSYGSFVFLSGAELGAGPYRALYPASAHSGAAQVTLPECQHSPTGELQRLPLYAVSSNSRLSFYNLCGVLDLCLTAVEQVSLSTVKITTNTTINGVASISGSGRGITLATPSNSCSTTLVVGTPQDISTPKHFYIYLPEGTYSRFDITMTAVGGEVCNMRANRNIAIHRGERTPVTLTDLSFALPVPEGAVKGLFSVGPGTKVFFSQGNLQYQPSSGTWQFAAHQYDYIGTANKYISSTYNGWIDLFGWGTSGYHDAADQYNTNYMPYSSSNTVVNASYNKFGYGPSVNMSSNNLTGGSAGYDWGVNNAISNGGGSAGLWRVLSKDEWVYLLNTRQASALGDSANARYAKAKVAGVMGLIVFPDRYSHPSGVSLPSGVNTPGAAFESNVYTDGQWQQMEAAGAAFLPIAGYRNGTTVEHLNTYGHYWSSSYYSSPQSHRLTFGNATVNPQATGDRCQGRAVRLVQVFGAGVQ